MALYGNREQLRLCAAPQSVTVSVNPLVTLAAGTYTGQVVITSQFGDLVDVVGVTLTVAAAGTSFFDNLPGRMSFTIKTGGAGITSQDVQIRNGGSGNSTGL